MAYSPDAACAVQHPAIGAMPAKRIRKAFIRCLYWICNNTTLPEKPFVHRTIETSK